MTSASEFQAKVGKAATNMDRMDGIVNGGIAATVSTDNGVVPSFAKVIHDFQVEADATLEGVTEQEETATASAEAAAISAATAQTASSAAVAAANLYPNTTAGLAGTTDGQYFSVPQTGTDFTILYRNNSGSALEINRYPSKSAVDGKLNIVDLKAALTALFLSLPDEANGDAVPAPGNLYLSSGVPKIA